MLKSYFSKYLYKFRNCRFIKKYPRAKEMIKYSIVGNTAGIIDFLLYIYLTRVFSFWRHHYLIANLFTMSVAVILRFTFHKTWTFRDNDHKVERQFAKFASISLLAIFASETILYSVVEHFDVNDIFGKIIASIAITLFAFIGTKTWVFKKSQKTID